MKHGRDSVALIIIGLFILITPLIGPASDDEATKQQQSPEADSVKKEAPLSESMPIYKPPLRGAPIGRIGGGTRGTATSGELPFLAALAPEHVGITVQKQPSLFWYLSKPTEGLIEFTLIDEQSIQPLLEIRFDSPVPAGIHSVHLEGRSVYLEKGKQYKWFVALVVDPEHRAKDIIAGGMLERVESPEALRVKLDNAKKADVPSIFAEAGIWYEALSTISDLIDASPDDQSLRLKRASLLEQVGLIQVAEAEQRLP